MTRLRIRHETTFRYEDQVLASYNEVRMRPMMADRQFVLTEQILVTPLTSQHSFLDYWGTRVSSLEILSPHNNSTWWQRASSSCFRQRRPETQSRGSNFRTPTPTPCPLPNS